MAADAKWYVAHTYSGYENKVKTDIEKSVENRGLEHLILEIEVPVENIEEKKGSEVKIVKRKLFPGYVVIKMVMTDESWYVVRNTRGVTGFVGPGSKPVPLTDEEVRKMGVEIVRQSDIRISVGDHIMVKSGHMEGFSGVVEKVDNETRKISAMIDMFDRKVALEIEASLVSVIEL